MTTVESPSSGSSSPPVRHRFPRRALIGAAAALAICAVLAIGLVRPGAAPASPSTPTGPGSVSGAPNLPPGFTDTFTDRYVDVGGVRLHAVVGGHGRPLLLIHGWPQTWYAWRLLMPALARDFQVIAVDQRGIGLSDKPPGRIRHRHPGQRHGHADGRARATSGSPCSARTPECRSATPWPPITRTRSSAWPWPRPSSRA